MGESQTKTKADQNQIDFFFNSQNLCLHKEIDVFLLNCTPNVMLLKGSSPKREHSVIIYSPSSCSKLI